LDRTQKATILEHLNNLATTALEASDFAPWSFTDAKLQSGRYVLAFENAAGNDDVRFSFDGELVEDSAVTEAFDQAMRAAIERWEAEERGDDEEDDDDEDEDDE
jgi:hypothetical protein